MNKEQTLALYAQGKDVWNKWANDMLAEKKRLEASGEWEASKVAWEIAACAEFSPPLEKQEFRDVANFNGFIFPDAAVFIGVTFPGEAVFVGVSFLGEAWFTGVTFSGEVLFWDATFSSRAWFEDVTFHKHADFSSINFGKKADFSHARFERQALFSGQFHEEAVFYAIDSKGGFTLTGTQFARVPNFIQAHFVEAPMLDGVVISEKAPRYPSLRVAKGDEAVQSEVDSGLFCADCNDITARYRTLKRMAIQGHDHRNEQNFFAAELKSMRGKEHQPIGDGWGWYWAGRCYESLSDFGRSPRRVLEWMFVQLSVFLYAYLFLGGTQAACTAGEGNRFWSAAQLALGKTLFPFGNVMDSTSHLSACLYGITKEFGQNDRMVPVIPDWFPFISLTQSLFSLLLIFLLLLAIRAHFRVK